MKHKAPHVDTSKTELINHPKELGEVLQSRLMLNRVRRCVAHIDSTSDYNFYMESIAKIVQTKPAWFSSWVKHGWTQDQITSFLQNKFRRNGH